MASNLEDQLIDKCERCHPTNNRKCYDSLPRGASSEGTDVERRPVWEVIDGINVGLPANTWENVATDGSINLDY